MRRFSSASWETMLPAGRYWQDGRQMAIRHPVLLSWQMLPPRQSSSASIQVPFPETRSQEPSRLRHHLSRHVNCILVFSLSLKFFAIADGAVASGIAAVESFESAFSAAMLHRHSASLSGAQLIVLEANLPAAVIEAGNSCKDCPSFACPACAEPVRKSDSANGRRDYGVRLHGARDAPLASMIHHGTSRIVLLPS